MLLGTSLLLLYLIGIPGIPLPGKAGLQTQPGPTTTPQQNHPSLFDTALLQRCRPADEMCFFRWYHRGCFQEG